MTGTFNEKNLVVITWNGETIPFKYVFFDAAPQFEILLFNYSGKDQTTPSNTHYDYLISAATECKGQVLYEVEKYLHENHNVKYNYIGFLDDDIILKVSDINFMLHIARLYELDAFQPSVLHDSFHSHRFNLTDSSRLLRLVSWVEIMAPFFKHELLIAARPFLSRSISSYGIDCYVIPFYQKIMGMEKTAVIHAVAIHHFQQITSSQKRYSNGLTAFEEAEKFRAEILNMVLKDYPHLLKDDTFMRKVLKQNQNWVDRLVSSVIKFKKLLDFMVNTLKNLYSRIN
ncbi:MAG: hypothetical protein KGO81_11215 [Bacteroidota bacterium]|nr:hypothetical protein [Bacteroidota bacterium]